MVESVPGSEQPTLRGVLLALLVAGVLLSGCALHREVTISPLAADETKLRRAANHAEDYVAIGDFRRAIALAPAIDAKPKPTLKELKALGEAELAAGRFDDARRHLDLALGLSPLRRGYAEICWALSQVEYWTKNFQAAHSWALEAVEHGLEVRPWWIGFLEHLQSTQIHRVEGSRTVTLRMDHDRPRIPRIETRINETRVNGIIDSGAAMTIVSDRLAAEARLPFMGELTGTFYGLLNEPIEVRFALIDRFRIGDMTIRSVPVAVMSGEKMKFFTMNRVPFHIDMLIGANLLREFVIDLDFVDSRIKLEWLSEEQRKPADDQNLFFVQGKPMVHATIDRRGWYLMIVDTGSEISYLNSTEIHKDQAVSSFVKVYTGTELQGLGGSTKRGIKVEGVGIGIDGWEGLFKSLPLYTSPRSGAFGLIGEDFLRHFGVTLDFGRMKLSLDRSRYGT